MLGLRVTAVQPPYAVMGKAGIIGKIQLTGWFVDEMGQNLISQPLDVFLLKGKLLAGTPDGILRLKYKHLIFWELSTEL